MNASRGGFDPRTLAVHVGNEADPATGAVAPPIHLATTFRHGPAGERLAGYEYQREGNPTNDRLREALMALEGGAEALTFASGMAAMTTLLESLPAGARVLFPDDCYSGLRMLFREFLPERGIVAEVADMSDLDAVRAACAKPLAVLWIETPSNPRMKISDIAALAGIGRAAGALVVVDNTFATPLLQRPLALGADVAMHSTTKYFGGHSDVLGGAVIAGADCPAETAARLRSWQKLGGAVPSPFDAWLLRRSLATMPIRVRAQSANAEKLASFLACHPAVERVHYPGLPGHPGHDVALRQMAFAGAMLSFEVRGGFAAARAVAGRVKLITRATSLGGVESLIEHRKPVEGPDSATPDSLLRFSVGLEHVDDLIADLRQALG